MATTEQFSLRWNNFHSNMTSGFHDLLESAEMVDVTLAVDGHFLQAHKIVLSICSPYFKQMFKANPCKHPIVILKDVRHENMKDILEFMYMGEVSVLRENLTQFLRTAELLQVKGLTGDDPGEDGSSSKDNKAECDNDEENEIYNELIETDVELPSYSHSSPTPMVPSPAMTKRTKNLSNAGVSGKRSKIENQQSPIKSSDFEPVQPKCELNTSQLQPTNDNSNILSAVKPELDDIKEPINLKTWDNHLSTSSSSDYLNSSAEQVNNFGQEWEVGEIKSVMAYKAGSKHEINGTVSLKIALRGINVTLKADVDPTGPLKNETIDYNERFEWIWDQGRFGFGPYAGLLQREFREAQYRGAPLPIIWVVDYFVIDGEGQRFGRFYRTAGWYTHQLMWTAFPCWILSTILFRSVIRYGAYFLGLCGGLQLLGNLIYLVVRNPFPVVIPFEEETLTTHFGFNYWCTFVLGLICVILACVIVYMDMYHDEIIYSFFGVNPLNSYDEVVYLTKEERKDLRRHQTIKHNRSMTKSGDIPLVEMEAAPPVEAEDDDDDVEYIPVYLKRKTVVLAPTINRGNKPNRHRMPLPPPSTSHAS